MAGKTSGSLLPVRIIDFSKKILGACEQYEGAWVDDVKRPSDGHLSLGFSCLSSW